MIVTHWTKNKLFLSKENRILSDDDLILSNRLRSHAGLRGVPFSLYGGVSPPLSRGVEIGPRRGPKRASRWTAPEPSLNQPSADSLGARREVAGKALNAPCRFVGLWPPAASNRPAFKCFECGCVSFQGKGWQAKRAGRRPEGVEKIFIQTSKARGRAGMARAQAPASGGVSGGYVRGRLEGGGQVWGRRWATQGVVHGLSRSCPRTGGRSALLRRSSTYPRLRGVVSEARGRSVLPVGPNYFTK
jgi:hypothetical protein